MKGDTKFEDLLFIVLLRKDNGAHDQKSLSRYDSLKSAKTVPFMHLYTLSESKLGQE